MRRRSTNDSKRPRRPRKPLARHRKGNRGRRALWKRRQTHEDSHDSIDKA